MSTLDQQIGKTRFRLTANTTLRKAARGVLIAAALWTLVIVVERALALGIPLWPAAAAACAVGLFVTAIGSFRERASRLRAAVVLDEAAGLKERVSTAITCREDADPFARAAVHDAEKTASGVHVPSRVPYRAPDLWPWSLATVIIAVIFFQFMPQLDLLAAEKPEPDDMLAVSEETQALEVALRAKMERVRKSMDDKPALAALRDDLAQLKMPDTPTRTPEDVRREAVKAIENVADKLKRQQETDALKSLDKLKRELAKLETPKGDDAGAKLSKALASGDMEAAKKAMSDLKKQLEEAAKTGDAESKQKLAEMQKKLEDLSSQLNKLADQKKLEKDLENKAGLSEEQAKKLMEQLKGKSAEEIARQLKKQLEDSGMTQKQIEDMAQKIAQNQQVQQQLKSMAQAMSKVAQACKQCQGSQGDSSSAMQGAAQDAMGQLSELEMSEQMMNEIEAQLAELDDLKQDACEGQGMGPGEGDPNQIGGQGPQYGRGYGSRIGKERAAHQYKGTKAKVRTKGGRIIGQMLIDGPQVKGEASAEVTDAVESALRDAEDAVERDEVQRQYERVVRTYFERLAGLMSEKAQPEPGEDDAGEEEPDDATPSEED